MSGRIAAAKRLGADLVECLACHEAFHGGVPLYVIGRPFKDKTKDDWTRQKGRACGMRCAVAAMMSNKRLVRVLLVDAWETFHVARRDERDPRGFTFDNDGEARWDANHMAGNRRRTP